MKKEALTIAELAFQTGQKMTIEQMKYIKGGDGLEECDDEKRRPRPGGGGVSTQRPNLPPSLFGTKI
jgi:hypothetical protein